MKAQPPRLSANSPTKLLLYVIATSLVMALFRIAGILKPIVEPAANDVTVKEIVEATNQPTTLLPEPPLPVMFSALSTAVLVSTVVYNGCATLLKVSVVVL